MSWAHGLVYAYDCETTGVDVFTDRIVSASLVKINNGQRIDHRSWLIAVDVDIPAAATTVHDITTDKSRAEGRPAVEVLAEIANLICGTLTSGFPLVVMNAPFDLTLLEVELERHQLPTLGTSLLPSYWHTIIDPLVLAKELEHGIRQEFVKGRDFKLPSLCERYGVEFTETHDSAADAEGAGLLAIALAGEEDRFARMTPLVMFNQQKAWRQGHQDGLRRYWERIGDVRASDVDSGWPLHSALLPGSQQVLV